MRNTLLPICCILFLLTSCVSSKKFSDLEVLKEYYKLKNDTLEMTQRENSSLTGTLSSTKANLSQTTTELNTTKASLADLQTRYANLNAEFQSLEQNFQKISTSSKNETASLRGQLRQADIENERMQAILTSLDRSYQISSRGAVLANDNWPAKLQRMQDISETLNSEAIQIQTLYQFLTESAILQGDAVEIFQSNNQLIIRLYADETFRSGRNQMNTKGRNIVKEITGIVLRNSNLNVEVEGHTDDQGSDGTNWNVSALRATAVAKEMINNEFMPTRVFAIGKSSHDPINPEKTTAARKQNRRVEMIIKPRTTLR